MSFFGWALLGGVATVAQFSGGASWSIVIPLITTLNCVIIVVVALRIGKAFWTNVDGLSIGLGILGIIAWYLTSEPLLAIIITTITDIIFTIPTLIKTHKDPHSEPSLLWSIYVFAGILGLVASTKYDLTNLLYPTWTIVGATFIWLLSLRKVEKKV